MAVLSYREVVPRTYEHKLGGSPTASCVWMATVDEPTSTSEVLAAIGIAHGATHPDHSSLVCTSISANESDRHHVTVTYSYELPDENKDPENPNDPPWLQPDQWSFSTTNASVACTEHYPMPNFNATAPLTNTAGDAIFGVARAEAELKITITGSRLQLDLNQVKKYVNTVNKTPWAGFPKWTVQCVGVSAQPERLAYEDAAVDYWKINIELIYRSSSHNIFLPNVGWNVIVNGKKERAWIYIEEGGERKKVPSPHPVPLNLAGGFLCGQDQANAADWDGGTSYEDDGTSYF